MERIYNLPPPEALALLAQVDKANTTLSIQQKEQRLAWMLAYVSARNGTCVPLERYQAADTRFTVRCDKGHDWRTSYTALTQGQWCKQCYFDAMRLTLADMQALAQSRGGVCLSTEYVDIHTPMHWRCKNGHEWHVKASTIQKSWCAQCHFDDKRTKIEDIKAWASSRGYTCLSSAFTDAKLPLHWRCDRGHEWQARWRGMYKMKRVIEFCGECREMLRSENRAREQQRKKAAKVLIGRMV